MLFGYGRAMHTSIWAESLAFLFPHTCPICEQGEVDTDRGVCPDCEATLHWFLPPWCDICGRPLDAGGETDLPCSDCLAEPPVFQSGRSIMAWDGAVKGAVARLKYGRRFHLGSALAACFVHLLPEYLNPFQYDLILAVPLHPSRLRWRGFNQAQLLAGHIGRQFRVPLAPRLLRRVRDTPPQAGLDREERLANLTEAFQVAVPRKVHGQRILLVDDVMTTGMTLSACAAALLAAGADRVDTLTLARALPGRAP